MHQCNPDSLQIEPVPDTNEFRGGVRGWQLHPFGRKMLSRKNVIFAIFRPVTPFPGKVLVVTRGCNNPFKNFWIRLWRPPVQ